MIGRTLNTFSFNVYKRINTKKKSLQSTVKLKGKVNISGNLNLYKLVSSFWLSIKELEVLSHLNNLNEQQIVIFE